MPGGVIEERVRARVNKLFDASGWTQLEFAQKCGREQQSWASKYLRGDLDADIDTMAAMATVFRLTLFKLIGEDPVVIPEPTALQREAQTVAELWPFADATVRQSLKALLELERSRATRPDEP